eukprot:517429-Rhodomonas_salina.2
MIDVWECKALAHLDLGWNRIGSEAAGKYNRGLRLERGARGAIHPEIQYKKPQFQHNLYQ